MNTLPSIPRLPGWEPITLVRLYELVKSEGRYVEGCEEGPEQYLYGTCFSLKGKLFSSKERLEGVSRQFSEVFSRMETIPKEQQQNTSESALWGRSLGIHDIIKEKPQKIWEKKYPLDHCWPEYYILLTAVPHVVLFDDVIQKDGSLYFREHDRYRSHYNQLIRII